MNNLRYYSLGELEAQMPEPYRRLRFDDDHLEAPFREYFLQAGLDARRFLVLLVVLIFAAGPVGALAVPAALADARMVYSLSLLALGVSLVATVTTWRPTLWRYSDVMTLATGMVVGLVAPTISCYGVNPQWPLPAYLGATYMSGVFMLARITVRRGFYMMGPVALCMLLLQFTAPGRSMLGIVDLSLQATIVCSGLFGAHALEMSDRFAWLRQRMLESTARTDPLTGVLNRRGFDEAFEALLRFGTREGKPVALVVLDVDFFKLLNDRYGHEYGDACLQTLGQFLRQFARRPLDQAARLGGEEFVLSLYDCSPERAQARCEQLRHEVELLDIENAGSSVAPHVTVSIGAVCRVPDGYLPSTMLMREADRMLYEAKRRGRNQVRLSTELSSPGGMTDTSAEKRSVVWAEVHTKSERPAAAGEGW